MDAIEIDYVVRAPVGLRVRFTVQGFTVLLGRSGSGKTSLLRALAGVLPAQGTPWQGVAPERRPIGYLPQETLLFPHLDVLDNTAYALRGAGRRARAAALLEGLGLAALAGRWPHELSGGQAKRVALARALAHGAELLLLDEPSAGLDSMTRDETLDWLIETAAVRRVPVLAATHDHEVAVRADRLALLSAGRIIQQGPARAVFAAPLDRAAAELLGYENIFAYKGVVLAARAGDIMPGDAGEAFTVLSARETARGLRLVCGPEPCVIADLRDGQLADYPPGCGVRLSLAAAKQVG